MTLDEYTLTLKSLESAVNLTKNFNYCIIFVFMFYEATILNLQTFYLVNKLSLLTLIGYYSFSEQLVKI